MPPITLKLIGRTVYAHLHCLPVMPMSLNLQHLVDIVNTNSDSYILVQQIRDAYMLNFFQDDALRLPSWCNATDPSVPFCQILGKYQMELPGNNTLTPYMPTWMKPVQLCLQLTPGLIIADSIRHTCTYELVNLSLTVVHNNCCNA